MKYQRFFLLSALIVISNLFGCSQPFTERPTPEIEELLLEGDVVPDPILNNNGVGDWDFGEPVEQLSFPVGALTPQNLAYLGAFRLPDDPGGTGWDYSGQGLTFFPHGNQLGRSEGLPGSLYIVGHDHYLQVAEISIPKPVVSKNLEELNFAEIIQPFSDISGGAITDDMAIPHIGIEFLDRNPGQLEGRLHFAIGQHIQYFEPSHGSASLDMGKPDAVGLWILEGFTNYTTNDYLFEIPEEFAVPYLNGYRLATGRFREGVWGGLGPALFAFDPWENAGSYPSGSSITGITPLLLYGLQVDGVAEILTDDTMQMDGYAESDHWWGGAWLTSEVGSAVIFTGTKALGKSWYGFANGVVWDYACADDNEIECPTVPDFPYDNRGFWADEYVPVIIFFDSSELIKVALGELEPYDPQPYAMMNLSDYWFDLQLNHEIYKRDLVGAAAFDRANGISYVVERLGDGYKSLIHVFQIQ